VKKFIALAFVGALLVVPAVYAAEPEPSGEICYAREGEPTGGNNACGPLVPCEYYGTVWVITEGEPEQITIDAVYDPDGTCEAPEAPEPTGEIGEPVEVVNPDPPGPRMTLPPTDTAP
jgi:hypothetical protein